MTNCSLAHFTADADVGDILVLSFFHYLAIIVGPTHFKAMDRDDNILSDLLIDSCLC